MDINDIRIKLNELKDEGYAKFNKKSCPDTAKEILGIKIPQLRTFAKQIVKNNKDIKLIDEMDAGVFEETILKGLIIAYSAINIDEKLVLIKNFIPEIDSWAITDTFCPALKIKTEDLDKVWDFILPYCKSNKEFEVRFAIIMMLDYYLIDEYVDRVIKVINEIENSSYYVQMAKAWTLAEIGVKFNDKVMNYLLGKNNLDKFTYNKTLQKMIESYRISEKQKKILKKMKRKD